MLISHLESQPGSGTSASNAVAVMWVAAQTLSKLFKKTLNVSVPVLIDSGKFILQNLDDDINAFLFCGCAGYRWLRSASGRGRIKRSRYPIVLAKSLGCPGLTTAVSGPPVASIRINIIETLSHWQ